MDSNGAAVICWRASCGAAMSPERIRRHAKFCSNTCSREYGRERYRELNPRPSVPTATRGTISELVVAVDLMEKGFSVFRALSPACACDLAYIDGNRLVRVEVRSAVRSRKGRALYPWKAGDDGRNDVLALVFGDGKIEYRVGADRGPSAQVAPQSKITADHESEAKAQTTENPGINWEPID